MVLTFFVNGDEFVDINISLCYIRFCSMSKHKKTRQEKIIADLRKKLATTQTVPLKITPIRVEKENVQKPNTLPQTISYTPTTSTQTKLTVGMVGPKTASFDYSYVYRDLRKTIALTVLAIGFEVVLFSIWR